LSSGRGLGRSGVIGALCATAVLLAAAPAAAETFTVTSNADTGAGTLRQAIDDAEANNNGPAVDQIQVSVTGNIDLASSLPEIVEPVTITGPGASNLHVRRDPSPSVTSQFTLFVVSDDTGDTVTIQDLTISGARAQNIGGGGIGKSGRGTLVLDKLVMSDNQAPVNGSGGAISVGQGFASIRNSTLSDNQAGFGGAIIVDQVSMSEVGSAEVVNSTIVGNKATDFGGGIYTNVSHIQILSSTITGNVADSDGTSGDNGGGTFNGGADALAFSVANTLYAGNQSGSGTPVANQCGGPHTSFGYNLRQTSEVDCTGFTVIGDSVFASAAMLGPLGSNGGPTPTIALLTGNPAIDQGNNVLAFGGAFPACPATDQRGFLRGGAAGRCDIGAFELGGTLPPSGGGGGGTTTPPATTSTTPPFNLAAAIKKCKKKFPKGPKRKKCIKRAKRRAQA
jgi:hypothetical protein